MHLCMYISIMMCGVMRNGLPRAVRGSIPGGNGVFTELHVLHKGQ